MKSRTGISSIETVGVVGSGAIGRESWEKTPLTIDDRTGPDFLPARLSVRVATSDIPLGAH